MQTHSQASTAEFLVSFSFIFLMLYIVFVVVLQCCTLCSIHVVRLTEYDRNVPCCMFDIWIYNKTNMPCKRCKTSYHAHCFRLCF